MSSSRKERSKHLRNALRARGVLPDAPGRAAARDHKARVVKAVEETPLDAEAWARLRRLRWVAGSLLALVFVWAYWPTLVTLVGVWQREPDYSHGFLVAPLAIFFVWARRDQLPPLAQRLAWLGLVLIVAAVGLRYLAGRYYVDALDGWSIPLWVAGVVWLLFGRRVFLWALPAVAFLWFAVPLPFRAERMLSYPLQGTATKLSCWALQMLGQPALAEGHTILLGDHQLAVEEACSGLRIFMSIVALACAYIILVQRPWWEKVLLFLSTVPIALAVNAFRIVLTAVLQQYVSSEAAATFSHDLAGWLMIVVAAALFGLVLWYLGKLFRQAEVMDIRSIALGKD